MQYRTDRAGNPISLLGYGCMRFSKKGRAIDLDKAEREVLEAISLGVNYFDTAYLYPGNEAALGEILARNHCRDRVNIATKLPQYLVRRAEDLEKYFREELRRLQTDHIDYYLLHMLSDVGAWNKLETLGVVQWIAEKKASGAIRQIGFSYHGSTASFSRVLDAYDWDFCMIQYNYMDENTQAGRSGLLAAHARGLPVVIMEPLRGGRLISYFPEALKKESEWSPAELAFRWLYDQKEVTSVLSGMNSLEMLRENARVASEAAPGSLSAQARALIEQAKQQMLSAVRVGCTGCGYCMPCPAGVDIPGTFSSYNAAFLESRMTGWRDYMMATAMRKTPAFASRCVGCGKCETACPQHLPIQAELKVAARTLETPVHHLAAAFFGRLYK
ncbi:MAG: aldo/keto reductase [Oscillospiraceae bacterium]|nr:aldo/keto reductase [Oscillospiraceae bacterium]